VGKVILCPFGDSVARPDGEEFFGAVKLQPHLSESLSADRHETPTVGKSAMNGILSPTAFLVLGAALLLGGLVAPLFAFLFAAFVAGALHTIVQDRRPAAPIAIRHRAF
jgi:hypothetical protein